MVPNPATAAWEAVGSRLRRSEGAPADPAGGWTHVPSEALRLTADDGVELHVEIDAPQSASRGRRHLAGRAPTVVLVHGFALSMQCWVLQRRALIDQGLRVVTYDQRGHGRSGTPDLGSCTVEQLGRDLATVIEATAPSGPVVLIGHSMGGMSVMSFAGQHREIVQDRVLAVGLVSTSPGGHEVIELGLGPLVGRVVGAVGPGLLTRLSRHAGPIGALRRMGKGVQDLAVARWAFDSPVSPALVDLVAEMIFETSFEVMAAFLPDIDGLDLIPALESLTGVETLVINGAGDLVTPASHSEEIVRHVPGAEHVVIEDAGHLLMLEHPDLVTEQLLALIQRARRAVADGVAVSSKPRVRRTVQDISKRRRAARARREAAS
ncbi:alpha/beta hydrolase [Phycicoccus endophyticus]|uniref:Alpha/beta hydrolase n=1 Tax=Phycicoccus endophyticus TaxID=1690220 RepID=A0A7G9R2K5_9MICO|nr:alpha/beta hydrolase [Phycicoccus endophyticus]NHI20710.1 alpha/beta hydrolase [Phycicoccus endophyticus]QNN49830.1 alpha/beta hydrolase [Phycicoccus endophyticus]GGL35529.1 lipase [Phycicoccus endophyticus]